MKQLRKRLTYANVMSTIAVFAAIGGASAFAATQLAKNSVGTKQLKSNAVTSAKIKKEAVTAAKIKNGAVGASKLGAGAVATDKLADAAVTTGKLADGAINSGKLADSSVNSNKLVEGERSEIIYSHSSSEVDLPEQYGTPSKWAQVATLSIPSGNWVLTANVGLGIGTAAPGSKVICRITQNGNILAQGGTQGSNIGLIPAIDEITLVGVATTTGQATVTCGDTEDGVGASTRTFVAERAGKATAG